ncbi:MAG TPA: GNAT family N-acetyltransferase [Candidatus Hungatella pullicola]|nr:GNAT family N-acetyltransferase [Candidatus Hungatella pullicola]
MKITVYQQLPKEAAKIREKVFIEEQGFCEEFDDTDCHAFHLVVFLDNVPAGTCRFFQGEDSGEYILGRIAVLKEHRGKNLGSRLVEEVESQVKKTGGTVVRLHAQQRAVPFYEKQGYHAYGAIELDEGCPHIWMMKKLPD